MTLVDGAEPVKGKGIVDVLNVFGVACDEMGETAGGDADSGWAEFGDHALEDAVDDADVGVVEAELEVIDRVAADDFCRTFDFDAGQAGGAGEEGVGGDVEAGGEGSADEHTFGGEDVEVGGGAEVDDDAGAAVFL